MSIKREWFGDWFDSHYYHVLYKNRDHQEAQNFIDKLVNHLSLQPDHKILDLACGKGRHAIYLHKLGYNVTGLDLSPKNIEFGNRFKKIFGGEKLSFFVHDMREVFSTEEFTHVFNIFTSFGYFEKAGENQKVIKAAATALRPGGRFVLDFFNTTQVIKKLVPYEKKTIEAIEFTIKKKVEAGFVVKEILVNDKGKELSFQEKVKSIKQEDFLKYFQSANLRIVDFFGDYNLNPFDPEQSDRMIFITEKTQN